MRATGVSLKALFGSSEAKHEEKMLRGLAAGEFYLWCEDNETPRALDEKRIQWSADDIIRNRPALSRWSVQPTPPIRAATILTTGPWLQRRQDAHFTCRPASRCNSSPASPPSKSR